MSDKPKTLTEAVAAFEQSFGYPVAIKYEDRVLIEIFWDVAVEAVRQEMQAEIDKRDAIIERYYDLCECDGGYECSVCRDSMPFIKRLAQGSKDEL